MARTMASFSPLLTATSASFPCWITLQMPRREIRAYHELLDYLKQHIGEDLPAEDLIAKLEARLKPQAPARRVKPEQIEAMRLMVEDGCNQTEIARTLKVSRNSVRRLFPEAAWSRQQIAEVSQAKRRFNSVMKSNGASEFV